MNLIFTTQTEMAYKADHLGQFFGTIFYALFSILFIDIIYSNVNDVAGYSKDDMLLFLFMTQVSLMINVAFSNENLIDLSYSVNNGVLDTILTKPMPALFFVSWKRLRLQVVIANVLGSILPLLFIINFTVLCLDFISVLFGFLILLLGLYCTHVFQFIAVLPSFWLGQSEEILNLTWAFEYNIGRVIPFEGFGKEMKTIFSTIIPVLISVGISTSVILQKSNALIMFTFVFVISILFSMLKGLLWELALRHYSSASS